tara:strand:+ start:40 stop:504 length:465 start_codon:yes stop_codon:yes gene_type:complete
MINVYFTYVLTGIISGILSTSIMLLFEIPFYRYWGIRGVYELHESEMMICKLLKRTFQNKISTLGIIIHIINGSLLAIPFVVFMSVLNIIPTVLIGISYAVFIWFVTLLPVHKIITGESIQENPYGYKPALVSIFGHFVYGIVLYYSYITIGGI